MGESNHYNKKYGRNDSKNNCSTANDRANPFRLFFAKIAGKPKRAKQSMFTGIGVGLLFGCLVFVLILLKGDVLASLFSTDAAVIQKGFEYLKGFAPETILTAIMFSMVGYFNGNNQTLWVMFQGLFQTLLVRLPMSYYMSIQPAASLTKIGLAAPTSTLVGILLNVIFFLYFNKKINNRQ